VSHPNGSEFEIVDADPRRVKRVRLRLASVVKAAE
jgi:magnesium and cobalt transporter